MAVPNDYPNFKDIKNEKLRRVCYILDTANIEGLCMPEYEELTNYLKEVDKKGAKGINEQNISIPKISGMDITNN